jgi:hypothetical protein
VEKFWHCFSKKLSVLHVIVKGEEENGLRLRLAQRLADGGDIGNGGINVDDLQTSLGSGDLGDLLKGNSKNDEEVGPEIASQGRIFTFSAPSGNHMARTSPSLNSCSNSALA